MPAFNRRIAPKDIWGKPAPLVYYSMTGLVLSAFVLVPSPIAKTIALSACAVAFFMAVYSSINYKDSLLRKSIRSSKKEGRAYTRESQVRY